MDTISLVLLCQASLLLGDPEAYPYQLNEFRWNMLPDCNSPVLVDNHFILNKSYQIAIIMSRILKELLSNYYLAIMPVIRILNDYTLRLVMFL